MTSYDYDYSFQEVTLKDKMQLVTNSFTRTVTHNELAYLDGFFGEVCEIDGIANGASGYLNFNADRKIRTTQVGDSATFTVGDTVYFFPQTNLVAGYLTNEALNAVPVGICTAKDTDDDWVEIRPFVQSIDVGLASDGSGVETNVVKMKEVVIDEDASGGLDFTVSELGLKVGDEVIDAFTIAGDDSAEGTVTVSHGDSGADITSAMTCAVSNAIGRTTEVVSGTLTEDGLTVTANGSTDRGRIFLTYIEA